MLTNYFKIAWRNLIKSKLFSVITIFGLSIGFTGTLLISLYISDELSYDGFHENGDQVYRILREFDLPDLKTTFQYTPSALAPSVQQSLPGIEKAVRVQSNSETVSANQKSFIESSILTADEGFFKIFDYRVIEGQPELGRPGAMVISETMAKKYFGAESPIGNMLSIGNAELEVTAVIQDVPENSHLQFHFVTPIRQQQTSWGRNNYITYVLLNKGEDSGAITAQIAEVINANTGQNKGAANHSFIPHLQPLKGIHFGKGVDVDIAAQGNISYLYLFIALAIFILTLACVNFINLSTARSAEKSREVGIRKTLGGQRKQIIFQFLGETVFLTTLAALIAIVLAHFSLPVLSSIAGKSIHFDINNNWYLWCAFICFVPIVGVIAGFYPSLIMSRFQASKAVKVKATGSDSKWFRNGLVVFQFAV
ncbi:MAG: ABC transporter permease, partial [Bacteroidota bacterium]